MASANQPSLFNFPKRSFGKKTPELRSFNVQWFKNHSWLHYDESRDLAFCFICMTAVKEGKVANPKTDKTFISTGFCNWKDATSKFRKHKASDCHREAVERHVTLPKQTRDVGETLSAAHSLEQKDNREKLLTILRSIRFLARQGLPLRSHEDQQSNFIQLLRLHGKNDPSILKWLEGKSEKYTCGEIQNEVLQSMALGILRQIAANIKQNNFFTIMADETTDTSNKEQVVIVLRHVDSDFEVHEDFIGL